MSTRNPKKDKKRKAAKKAKKQRKIANRTAITLTKEDDQKALDAALARSDDLWNIPLDISGEGVGGGGDQGMPVSVRYCFVDDPGERERILSLWDNMLSDDPGEKKRMLSVDRAQLVALLEQSLGAEVPEKLLAPPPKAVRVFQAQFLKSMMPETDAERTAREAARKAAQDHRASFPRVVLAGLRKAELNGRTGIQGPWDKEKGRYLVKLDSDDTLVHVLPENLRRVNDIDTASDAAGPAKKERGVVIIPGTSTILQMSVFMILKDRLQQLVVRASSTRGAWFVMLYVLWTLTSSLAAGGRDVVTVGVSGVGTPASDFLSSEDTIGLADDVGSASNFELNDDALDAMLIGGAATPASSVGTVLSRWASWLLIPIFLFATFQDSPECRQVRAQFTRFCDTTLCHDRSFPHTHMEFTSDSYLAAAMLLLMAKAHLDYLIIVYVVAWPQALLWIERCNKSASSNDKKCLVRMRTALLWLNKFLLLYKAWFVSWAGMFVVCAVSFTTISKFLFDLAMMVIFMGLAAAFKGMEFVGHKLPAARALSGWAQRSRAHHLAVFAASCVVCGVIVWGTWEWGRWFAMPVRGLLFFVLFSVFPQYCWVAFAWIIWVVQVLVNILQKILSYLMALPSRVGAGRGSINGTNTANQESDAYEYDFDAEEDEEDIDGLD